MDICLSGGEFASYIERRMAFSFDDFKQSAMAELDSVYRFAHSLSYRDAEDLVQEVYLRAIKSWKSFQPGDSGIKPWLFRIVYNTHITRATKNSREQQRRVADAEMDQFSSVPTNLEPVDWSQFEGELVDALNQLPDGLRSSIVLWALEDLSYQEIAEITAVPIGTVMSRLHRARARLQELLTEFAGKRRIIPV